MPRVRIESPEDKPGKPLCAQGTKIYLDDVDLKGVTDISAHWPAGNKLATVDIKLVAMGKLDFVADSQVNVTITVMPGFELVVEKTESGGLRYTSLRIVKID